MDYINYFTWLSLLKYIMYQIKHGILRKCSIIVDISYYDIILNDNILNINIYRQYDVMYKYYNKIILFDLGISYIIIRDYI